MAVEVGTKLAIEIYGDGAAVAAVCGEILCVLERLGEEVGIDGFSSEANRIFDDDEDEETEEERRLASLEVRVEAIELRT